MPNSTRSEYIKKLMEDKESLKQAMEETTKETVRNILGEAAKEQIKQMLNEAEDTFEVEEVGTESDDEEKKDDDVTKEMEEIVDEPTPDVGAEEGSDDAEAFNWDDLDSYVDEDGEYDLTGMPVDSCVKVLKVVDPTTDNVRVIQHDNGTLELKDDEAGTDYIIDLDGVIETEDDSCCAAPEENVIDLELDVDEGIVREDTNLGYTDNYQSKTAMTTPDNHEPANPKATYSMDGGVPKGTEKPYAGTTNPSQVGEPFEIEVEVNEAMTTQEDGPYNRGDGMLHGNTNDKAAVGRNASIGGKKVHGTVHNSISDEQLESIKHKANEVFMENKQLNALLPKIKTQLEEAIVINQSLSNIVRIINENVTTQEEKSDIIKRFGDVKTREESNRLFNQISEELKRSGARKPVENVMNAQLAESKNHIMDKPLYQSEDLSQVLSLMSRLDKIK